MNSLSSSLLNADEEEAVDALRQLTSYQPSSSPFPASLWFSSGAPPISCGGVGERGSGGEEEINQRKQHATEELIKNPIATSTTTTTTSINYSRESSSNEISSADNLRGLHHVVDSITSKSLTTTTTMRTTTTTTTKRKGESGLNETKRFKLPPPPPPPSLAAEKPTMITCECGAVIRRRTVWKHSLTRKHISFMEQRLYRPTHPHQRSTSSAVSSFSSSRTPSPLTGQPIPLSQPHLLSSYLIAGWPGAVLLPALSHPYLATSGAMDVVTVPRPAA